MAVWIFGALFVGIIIYISFKPDTATIVTISSKHVVNNERGFYVAKKKSESKGKEAEGWDYYNDGGDKIKNKELKVLIFESFKNEDWYGDFDYYVDDSKFLGDVTIAEDVIIDKKIIQEIEESVELEKHESV